MYVRDNYKGTCKHHRGSKVHIEVQYNYPSQWLAIIERIGSQIPLDIHYRHDNHFYAYQSGSDRQRKG